MSEESYVSADQGIELLGEKPSKFYYHVDRGEIATEIPARPGKGKKNNRYLVADILQVKKRLLDKKTRKSPQPLIDWVVAKDVPVALKLSQLVYSEEVDLEEAALYQAWRKNNDKITIGAFNTDRTEVYATIQLVPLPEQEILDVLAGRREESSIAPDEIESFDRPGAYTLLCTSVTALKSRPMLLYELLYRYTQYWLEMYPERYISKIFAQTVSESGAMLAQHMFMQPRYDLAYNAFELNMLWPPASKLIRKFKQQMEEKAPLPPDLRWPPVEEQQKLYRFKTDRDEAEAKQKLDPPTA
jgi:hypothetical protein